jgi:transcriptional regulator with XRE-family HTH domain
MTFARALGLTVRRVRRAADVTQETLAERAGMQRSSLANYEAGRRVPRADVLVSLATELDVPPSDLLPRPGWKPR